MDTSCLKQIGKIVAITYKHTDMAYLRKRFFNNSDPLFFCGHIYNVVVSPEAIGV